MRVSYSGNTSAFQADAAGSIPATRSILKSCMSCLCAHIAQLVERVLGKDEVTGSNPVMSSILCCQCIMHFKFALAFEL